MLTASTSSSGCARRTTRACAGRRNALGVRLAHRQLSAPVSAAQADVQASSSGRYPALLPLDASYEAAHAFSPYANWLVPGRLMVGRYPYVEPSRCTTREQGEQQLTELIRAGITTFVSLQEEVPAQADMRIAGVNGFLPYKATAELIHAALIGPPPEEVMSGLRNPMLDKYLPPKRKGSSALYASYAAHTVELGFVHSPIVDLGVPNSTSLLTLVHDLELRLAAGQSLYVHCWGGRGRVGTVGACMLASMYGLDADEALARVQRAFDTRHDSKRRSPETDEQHAFVRQFVATQLKV